MIKAKIFLFRSPQHDNKAEAEKQKSVDAFLDEVKPTRIISVNVAMSIIVWAGGQTICSEYVIFYEQ